MKLNENLKWCYDFENCPTDTWILAKEKEFYNFEVIKNCFLRDAWIDSNKYRYDINNFECYIILTKK